MVSQALVRIRSIQHEESARDDQRRFQELYQSHRDALLQILYRFTGDWSSAEDSVHHAFATLFSKRREYDLSQSPKSLLVTIALNHARMQHRAHAQPAPAAESAPASVPDRQSRIQGLVLKLPAEERAIVVLRFYDHLSYQEIAEALGLPLGTVKWKMHEAIRKLRPALEALSDEV